VVWGYDSHWSANPQATCLGSLVAVGPTVNCRSGSDCHGLIAWVSGKDCWVGLQREREEEDEDEDFKKKKKVKMKSKKILF
jgi:hypothetical protein